MVDPLAGSPWSRPDTVAGFAGSPPNATLLQVAQRELARAPHGCALDLGCGAARNAAPLAALGWRVLGLDLSMPMLVAARERIAREVGPDGEATFALAPMNRLPVADQSCDLVVAHGVWNLARSGDEFRDAVRDAARAARDGAALFVFTFSRNTLPPEASPVAGETFVFTQFSGEPQCFLTEEQLIAELRAAGFEPDDMLPIRELNRRPAGALPPRGAPVIYEGLFRRRRDERPEAG